MPLVSGTALHLTTLHCNEENNSYRTSSVIPAAGRPFKYKLSDGLPSPWYFTTKGRSPAALPILLTGLCGGDTSFPLKEGGGTTTPLPFPFPFAELARGA